MRRIIVCTLSLSVILAICFLAGTFNELSSKSSVQPNSGLFILIDAGHGGMDGGTSAADGTLEKDINLSIAKKLDCMLKAAGFNTVMLRTTDELIGDNSLSTIRARKVSDIKTRLEIAQSYPDSILVSIHQNHYSVEKYNGAQVFYSPNLLESRLIAQSVQDAVVNNIQPFNVRQIKQSGSNIYLLYNCRIPSIMVECGFLSNTEESQKLKNDEYQKQMSFSILNGILNYLE